MSDRGFSYDELCADLARDFLADEGRAPTPEDVRDLAQVIQDAVEGWFAGRSLGGLVGRLTGPSEAMPSAENTA